MKRFLINVSTNWCGEENTFSAIANNESELDKVAEEVAYNNFCSYGGQDAILKELFGDEEEYTDEMFDEASEIESEYYFYDIEEWDEERSDEEWDWYELVYDGRE